LTAGEKDVLKSLVLEKVLFKIIEVGLMLLVGMNWNSHALGTKN